MRACLDAMSALGHCEAAFGRRAMDTTAPTRAVAPAPLARPRLFMSTTVNNVVIELSMGIQGSPFDAFVNDTTVGRFDATDTGLSRTLHDAMFDQDFTDAQKQRQEPNICKEYKTYATSKHRQGTDLFSEVQVQNETVPEYHAGWQRALGVLKDHMQAKIVIHAVGPNMSVGYAKQHLQTTIERTLQCAENRPGVTRIAFPVICGNNSTVTQQATAREVLVDQILKHVRSGASGLVKIGILAADDEEYKQLLELLADREVTPPTRPLWLGPAR
jgi:hypothetical protein